MLRAYFGLVRGAAWRKRCCAAAHACLHSRSQDGLGPKSAHEIAARLGVSDTTIGSLLQRGLGKLRHPQRAGFLEGYAAEGSAA